MQSLKASCRPIGGLHKPTSFMPGFSHAVAQPTRAAWGRQTCAGAPGTSGRETMYANAAVASQAGTPSAGAGKPAKKKVKKLVDINGDVTKDLGNGMFQIKLENGVSVMAHLSGKIRQNRIKIVTGDKVTVELSPYDLTRGRITYRFKPGEIAAAAAAAAAAQNGNSQ